ncbi:MAG: DNA/RNA nuclease SfsA [Candidatus Melainabacteria bacterium]|nr:DNA/RNA nuclease SfsA [Candidatus Melainabacteria bacterium]
MNLESLCGGRLIKRYKRFLADVELEDGSMVTAHCPNPGSMKGVADEGMQVYLACSDNKKRKLPYTLTVVVAEGSPVVVDTGIANRLVKELLRESAIPELSGFAHCLSEPPYRDGRFDFLLSNNEQPRREYVPGDCLVEVKSTTLKEGSRAMFPDAPTERGRRHLARLSEAVTEQLRAVQLFLVARADTSGFSPAWHIDPRYGEALVSARKAGVETLAYAMQVDLSRAGSGYNAVIGLKSRLEMDLRKPDVCRFA